MQSTRFISCPSTQSKGDALSINSNAVLTNATFTFSYLFFSACTANNSYSVTSTLKLFIDSLSKWKNLLHITDASSYNKDLDGAYTGCYSSTSEIALHHLFFKLSEGAQTTTYASPSGSASETCGWSDILSSVCLSHRHFFPVCAQAHPLSHPIQLGLGLEIWMLTLMFF